ncbi:mitochondrial carrier [Cladochytrium replicatum]|nr:mitochondrial carrier [Cladochytrium replicatum]
MPSPSLPPSHHPQAPLSPAMSSSANVPVPLPSIADFVSGTAAGAAQVLTGHPLDTLKVRLQLDSTNRFKGPWDCLSQTVRNEGFLALYKGMASPIAGVGFVNAVLFSAYGWLKNVFVQSRPGARSPADLPLIDIALAGAGGGAINTVVAGPIELFKIRLQAQYDTKGAAPGSLRFKGPAAVAAHLYRSYGVRHGIFRGFWATFYREMPGYAGFYAGFEGMKRVLLAKDPTATPKVTQLMTAGAIAGVCYWSACYPLDVVKSKIQQTAPPGFPGVPATETLSGNVITAFRAVWKESGWKGMWRGYGTSVVRSLPAAAATFTVFELTMRAFEK